MNQHPITDFLEWTGVPRDEIDSAAAIQVALLTGSVLSPEEEKLAMWICARRAALMRLPADKTVKAWRQEWAAVGNGSNPDAGIGNRRSVLRGFRIVDPHAEATRRHDLPVRSTHGR